MFSVCTKMKTHTLKNTTHHAHEHGTFQLGPKYSDIGEWCTQTN
jgi:hypothetical protein